MSNPLLTIFFPAGQDTVNVFGVVVLVPDSPVTRWSSERPGMPWSPYKPCEPRSP